MTRHLTFAFAVLFTIFGWGESHAELQESWVARYNGPGNGGDSACCISLDRSGNVYVFGPSGGGSPSEVSALIKYDSQGKQLWVARDSEASPNFADSNAPGGRHSLGLDGDGNAYVTGVYWPAMNNSPDFVTAKYSANGSKLWSARFNSASGYSYDAPSALAVDGAGNVFVTGFADAGAYCCDATDCVTIKYDANGNQHWVARYNNPANLLDRAVAVALDANGNVYITGYSSTAGSGLDYLTIKYDTNGTQIWTARYDSPFHSADEAVALTVDVVGNVYVTGKSVGSGDCSGNGDSACQDITTVKYDTNGNQLWVARRERLGQLERATDIAVDSAGHVYVTGTYAGILKYDANGVQRWASGFDVSESGAVDARALALDNHGNAYVTGSAYDGLGQTYATAQYDSDGNRLWAARYSGPGSWGHFANALAVDEAGQVFVTGGSAVNDPQFSDDFATIKYAPTNVAGLPTIATPPQGVTVSMGGSATLSVTANGPPPLLYRWLGGGLTQYESATPTLILSNLLVTDIADWSVEVSNDAGKVVSPRARVMVNGPPVIRYQPQDRIVVEGNYVTAFQVGVAGTPPLTFRWFREGTPVGSNRSFLDLPDVQAMNAGTYTAVVTNSYGAVTSAPVKLFVQSRLPTIVTQPQSPSLFAGETALFSVSASSPQTPLRYQWQFNGNNLFQETNATLTLTQVRTANGGDYRVIVANSFGSVTSALALLTVMRSVPGLTNSTPIRIPDYGDADPSPSSIFVSGVPVDFGKITVVIHGLSHSFASDLDILLVGPNGKGVVLMSEAGQSYDLNNVTLVFDDEADGALDAPPIISGVFKPTNFGGTNVYFGLNAPPGPYGDELSVFKGTNPNGLWGLYVFDSEEDDSGVIAGGWSLSFGAGYQPTDPDALDKWHVRYSASGFLFGVTSGSNGFVAVGSPGTILASPDGYEWIPGASNTNVTLNDVVSGGGTYVAVGVAGAVVTSLDSSNWVRRISATNSTLNDVAYGGGRFVAVGESGTIQVSVDSGVNWQAVNSGTNRALYGVAYGQGLFVAVGASGIIRVSTNGINWVPGITTNNVILNAVAHGDGLFVAVGANRTILTSPDGLNWSRQTVPPGSMISFHAVIYANGTFVCGGDISTIFSSAKGVNWVTRTFVDGPSFSNIYGLAFDGNTLIAACPNTANLICQSDPVWLTPPRIARPPRDTIVRLGNSTNLTVTAAGTSPFTYRWQRDGVPLPGATNRVLTFSNTQESAEADYAVTVESEVGSVTSTSARLKVGVPPTIAVQPLGQGVIQGGTATFSIEMNGTAPFSYGWRRPPSVITAVQEHGRQSFWTVTNVQPGSVGIYGVYVTNDFGTVVSRGAQLTLLEDADGDGLPDQWETNLGLNTNDLTDALLDLDGDGVSNVEEYRSGSNPTNAASVLRISTALSENMLSLTFNAESNKTYTVQRSENPEAGQWERFIDLVARTNRRIESITGLTNGSHRFYRIVTPRQP